MSISLQKLKRLWNIRSTIITPDSVIKKRAEKIYDIAGGWEKTSTSDFFPAHKTYNTPEEEGIPKDGWGLVMAGLKGFYAQHPELKGHVEQVDKVAELLHLQYRDGRFRVSSNAEPQTPWESATTKPTNYCNPETHLASYNYPFEIIKFFLACTNEQVPDLLRRFHENRFIHKFIWMLANRTKIVPILSLFSFRELEPLFREVAGKENQGNTDSLNLPFNKFVDLWPKASNHLCNIVTGKDYPHLIDKEKQELAWLLFIASTSETTTKNAFDMIQTGNRAIILYGPPGTGKTFIAKRLAEQLLTIQDEQAEEAKPSSTEDFVFNQHNFTKVFGDTEETPKQPSQSFKHGCWEIVQFHPSYSYYDFIGGITPNVKGESLSYTKREGVFKRICDAAVANTEVRFILIIDEINRADLSSVFGELLYALEYRGEPVNTVQFGQFVIPKNVYLIGTMNTTDKSLVSFDLALRRRFSFMKLVPDLKTLEDWNVEGESAPNFHPQELTAFIARAEALNTSLVDTKGLDLPKDYAIGQAYFMKIRDFCDESEEDGFRHFSDFARERLWDYHLEPLIEEYLGAEATSKKKEIADLKKEFTK